MTAPRVRFVCKRRSFFRTEERPFTHKVCDVENGERILAIVPNEYAGELICDALNVALDPPFIRAKT